eukprot:gene8646-10239_t
MASQQQNKPVDNMLDFVFDLPSTSLIMVTTEEDIQRMKTSLMKATLIGIDTETKPTFVPKAQLVGGPNLTALIQIAVRCPKSIEEVFVVDMIHISRNSRLLILLDYALQQGLLENQCFKLGQGLTNDLRELAKSYPTVKAFRLTSCVLETHDLIKYLKPVLTNPISLKNLVKEFLHLNLSKSQQMSNWAKRPLTSSQLHYAACDALVLLRLYDAIYCEIEDKLSAAGDSSAAESDSAISDTASETHNSGEDNESNRSVSPTASSTSTNATVKETLMTLSRTVDFIGQDFSHKASNNKGKGQKGLYGHKQDTAARFPESSLLNNSVLRGWQSQSAKQWLKQQTSAAPGTSISHSTNNNAGPGKRSAEGSPREPTKRPRRNSFGSNSGAARDAAEEEDVRIPLPKGTGRHVVFSPPNV